jgi:hypothetical protein
MAHLTASRKQGSPFAELGQVMEAEKLEGRAMQLLSRWGPAGLLKRRQIASAKWRIEHLLRLEDISCCAVKESKVHLIGDIHIRHVESASRRLNVKTFALQVWEC